MAEASTLKILKNQVQSALSKKDWATGVDLLRKWCAQKPQDPRGWYYLAYFQMMQGQYQAALEAAEKSLNLEPGGKSAQEIQVLLEKKIGAQKKNQEGAGAYLWKIGSVVASRYEVRDSKKGGMGEVFFAFDRELDQMVAIKAPLPSLIETEGKKNRFYREAEAWMGLGIHPNICVAYYVNDLAGAPWLFIEYVSAGTLDLWLKEKDLSLRRKLDIAIQIAFGMRHTHSIAWRDNEGQKHIGMVHRDLKPANILMDEDGIPKITDFGLVGLGGEIDRDKAAEEERSLHEAAESLSRDPENIETEIDSDVHWQTITVEGSALGTPPYMAPEQWRSAHAAGFSADVYAFGCILYDIFCGRRPFRLDKAYRNAMPVHKMFQWEKMHRESRPPDPREFNPDLGESLAELMLDCLAKDQEERPADFGVIRDRLLEIYQEVSDQTYPRPEPRASRLLADSLNNQGVSYATIGQPNRAETAWREAIKADPHHHEATFNLAMHDWLTRNTPYDEVYRRMKNIGHSRENAWRRHQLQGRMLLFLGNYTKAVRLLRKAADDPNAPFKVHKDLGLALCAQGGLSEDQELWAEAENCFQQVLQQNYEDPSVVVGTALSLRRQGRRREAKAFYDQSLARHPDMSPSVIESAHKFLPGQEFMAQVAHQGWINALAFTPDGRFLICGGENKISLWPLTAQPKMDGETVNFGTGYGPGQGLAWGREKPALGLSDIRPLRRLNENFLRGGLVSTMTLCPNPFQVLTGGTDGVIRLWDLSSGKCLRTMKGHEQQIHDLAVSKDGRYFLSGGEDATFRLWDLNSGKCYHVFDQHLGPVVSVAFSPDGSNLLSVGQDRNILLWDSYSEKVIHKFDGGPSETTYADFSPDDRFLMTISKDKSIRVWTLKSRRLRRVLTGHSNRVTCARFSPDSKYILSGGHDRTLNLWETASGRLKKTFYLPNRVDTLAICPSARLAALVQADPVSPETKIVRLMEFPRQDRDPNPFVVTLPISAALADQREAEFRAFLDEAELLLAERRYQEALQQLIQARGITGYERDEEALILWRKLAVRFPRKWLRTAWEVDTFRGHSDRVSTATFFNQGRQLLSGGRDGRLRIWDVREGLEMKTLTGHTGAVRGLAVFDHGRQAISVSADSSVRIWDLNTGICNRVLLEHNSEVNAVAAGPDGRFALTGGSDGAIHMWDLMSKIRIKSMTGHTDSVTSAAFAPDGSFAVTGSRDRSLRLWDLDSGECLRILKGHPRPVTSVVISPDGKYIISAGEDGIIRKWELEKDELPETFAGHTGAVNSLDVSADSFFFVSGSEDRSLRLWNLNTGKCVSTFEGHSAEVASVSFDPEGQFVISASGDKTLRLWRLDWQPDVRPDENWDEAALPFLELFLTLQTPYPVGGLVRRGRPDWNDDDFNRLLLDLHRRGYGWLQPKGVQMVLKELARNRKTPLSVKWRQFKNEIKLMFSPLKIFKKPIIIGLKILPSFTTAFFMIKYDFFGLPVYLGLVVIIFLFLIMFAKRK